MFSAIIGCNCQTNLYQTTAICSQIHFPQLIETFCDAIDVSKSSLSHSEPVHLLIPMYIQPFTLHFTILVDLCKIVLLSLKPVTFPSYFVVGGGKLYLSQQSKSSDCSCNKAQYTLRGPHSKFNLQRILLRLLPANTEQSPYQSSAVLI